MRVAFVGIEKDWEDLWKRDYIHNFVKHHLELPFYYCRDGNNSVDIWTNTKEEYEVSNESRCSSAPLRVRPNADWNGGAQYDVVVHWRKWFEDFYGPNAVNVINSQDHSYSREWLQKVNQASKEEKLHGILCFPTWHERNLRAELKMLTYRPRLLPGVTLGVDAQVYKPSPNKARSTLLWASDIGRGLFNGSFLTVMAEVFKKDHTFRADVCYPDYSVSGDENLTIGHPAIRLHRNLNNGPELWDLFNKAGFLPYTSTFMEPSSRAHRQAMAAGCVVLYPPNKGTPSELLTDGFDGIIRDPADWPEIILNLSQDTGRYERISKNARDHAVKENWEVQAKRFNELFEGIRNDS